MFTKKIYDDYGNIDETKAKTLESLILYLGLPDDRLGINEVFKDAI